MLFILGVLLFAQLQQVQAQTAFENVVEVPEDTNMVFQLINEPCWIGSSKEGAINLANDTYYFFFAFNGLQAPFQTRINLGPYQLYIGLSRQSFTA